MPKKSAGHAKQSAGSVTWTGSNLAEVRGVHANVAHYPEEEGVAPFPRDASQHPDNLHVETPEGSTLILGIGDTLTRDAEGRLGVEKGTTPPRELAAGTPRVLHATGRERGKTKSRTT